MAEDRGRDKKPYDDLVQDMTRRRLLGVTGASLLTIGAGGLLAACGSDSSSSSSSSTGTPASGGTPKPGGTLRVGQSGGGATDTLEAQNLVTNADYARGYALYEGLTKLNDQGQVENVLAQSLEPNSDGTEWTITLRPNVKLHDGSTLKASDVLYSFKRIQKNKFPGAAALGPMNTSGAKVVSDTVLKVPFDQPYGILPEQLTLIYCFIVPEGYDPKKPIGTGPFKYQSFTPGEQSTFVKFDEYWDTGKPYLDKLVITNVEDETAQVNAFQAGQVDAVDYLSSTSVNAVKGVSGAQVIIAKTGAWGPFTMGVNKAPLSDVKVRQALRLIPDRPQMLQQVFSGYGQIANDLFGIYDPDFKKFPQRQQDIEQAKSLLKQAGQSDLRLDLVTTANAPGQLQAAQVFATQAKQAGVTVQITKQTPTEYFAKSYLKVPFSQDYWPYQPYLVTASQATVGGAPFNATFQNDPTYNDLFKKASQTTDDATRKQAVGDMLDYDYNKGGNIIPYNFPVIDAVASNVKGVVPAVTGVALGNFNWKVIWLSS